VRANAWEFSGVTYLHQMVAAQVLDAATVAWHARSIPAYVQFTLPCADTALAHRCDAGDGARFTVRMADGRTYAETVPKDGATTVKPIMNGGLIFGPGGTPLGFFRQVGNEPPALPPPNLAPDPLKTIATVTAKARTYAVSFDGSEFVGGVDCYRLKLKPLGDPERYPLRQLWVDKASSQIRKLTYEWDFGDNHKGLVHYEFAPVGDPAVWTIVHIDAQNGREKVADDLQDIAFPDAAPDEEFAIPQMPAR
jgi:hypothetical protein